MVSASSQFIPSTINYDLLTSNEIPLPIYSLVLSKPVEISYEFSDQTTGCVSNQNINFFFTRFLCSDDVITTLKPDQPLFFFSFAAKYPFINIPVLPTVKKNLFYFFIFIFSFFFFLESIIFIHLKKIKFLIFFFFPFDLSWENCETRFFPHQQSIKPGQPHNFNMKWVTSSPALAWSFFPTLTT